MGAMEFSAFTTDRATASFFFMDFSRLIKVILSLIPSEEGYLNSEYIKVYRKEKHRRRNFSSAMLIFRMQIKPSHSSAGKGNAVFLGDGANLLNGQLIVLGNVLQDLGINGETPADVPGEGFGDRG